MARSSSITRDADGDSITAAILGALACEDRDTRARGIAAAAADVDPDLLVSQIADPDDAVRRNAAMDALARGGGRSVPALVRALDADDAELVMFSANVLGRTRDRAAIPHLIRLLRHDDINVVQAAIESLAFLRAKPAVEPLVDLLDRDPWVRLAAIHALGEIGDPRAVDPIGTALADSEAWAIAIAALGKLRSPAAIGHLAEALRGAPDDDFEVPLVALGDALRRHPEPDALAAVGAWRRLAERDDDEVHGRLERILTRAASSAAASAADAAEAAAIVIRTLRLQRLYPTLLRGARNPAVRPAVQLWTIAIGAGAASAIGQAFADPSPAVRALACRCAGALHLRALADHVQAALADPEVEVRTDAALALSRLGNPAAAAAVAALLLDPTPSVREAAYRALAGFEPAAASAALLELPRDGAPVLAAMLRVMSAQPHPDQLPFLIDCLTRPEPEARARAIEALAEQPGIDPLNLLEPCLDDDDAQVRTAAIRVVGRRRTARARNALLDRLVRRPGDTPRLVEALLAMDGRAVAPHLLAMCRSQPPERRAPLVEALAELDEPAVEPLAVALTGHADPAIRCAGLRACGRLGTPPSRRQLGVAATDPAWEVRATAAEALAAVEDGEAERELERLSLDDHPEVARTARHALERRRGG